jgi:hypothetical protein
MEFIFRPNCSTVNVTCNLCVILPLKLSIKIVLHFTGTLTDMYAPQTLIKVLRKTETATYPLLFVLLKRTKLYFNKPNILLSEHRDRLAQLQLDNITYLSEPGPNMTLITRTRTTKPSITFIISSLLQIIINLIQIILPKLLHHTVIIEYTDGP